MDMVWVYNKHEISIVWTVKEKCITHQFTIFQLKSTTNWTNFGSRLNPAVAGKKNMCENHFFLFLIKNDPVWMYSQVTQFHWNPCLFHSAIAKVGVTCDIPELFSCGLFW